MRGPGYLLVFTCPLRLTRISFEEWIKPEPKRSRILPGIYVPSEAYWQGQRNCSLQREPESQEVQDPSWYLPAPQRRTGRAREIVLFRREPESQEVQDSSWYLPDPQRRTGRAREIVLFRREPESQEVQDSSWYLPAPLRRTGRAREIFLFKENQKVKRSRILPVIYLPLRGVQARPERLFSSKRTRKSRGPGFF